MHTAQQQRCRPPRAIHSRHTINNKQPQTLPPWLRARLCASVIREQDMTLAAGRVALRKIRAELRDSAAAKAEAEAEAEADSAATESSLVVLASATTNASHLGELLLPARVSV